MIKLCWFTLGKITIKSVFVRGQGWSYKTGFIWWFLLALANEVNFEKNDGLLYILYIHIIYTIRYCTCFPLIEHKANFFWSVLGCMSSSWGVQTRIFHRIARSTWWTHHRDAARKKNAKVYMSKKCTRGRAQTENKSNTPSTVRANNEEKKRRIFKIATHIATDRAKTS